MRCPHWLVLKIFDAKERIRFYRGLAAYLDNNMNLMDAMRLMQKRVGMGGGAIKQAMKAMRDGLEAGQNLPAAMQAFIPADESLIITSGTEAGRQSEALKLAADFVETRQGVWAAVGKELSYPLFLCALFIALLCLISLKVIPELSQLSDPSTWGSAAHSLHSISSFIASWKGVACAGTLIALLWLMAFSLPRWTGRGRNFMEKLPPWSIYRLLMGSVWMLTLATLLRGGVQATRALQLTAGYYGDSTGSANTGISPWLRHRVGAVHSEFAKGKNLGRAMLDCGYNFPDERIVEEFQVYATLPGFENSLHSLSQGWLEQGIARFKRACSRLNNLSLLCIMLLLGLVGLTIMELVTNLASQQRLL